MLWLELLRQVLIIKYQLLITLNMSDKQDMESTNEEKEVIFDEEGSEMEQLLTSLVKGYEEAANRFAQGAKDIKYELTVTIHKVPRPEGNKDIAYLRLVKHAKDKEGNKAEPSLILQQMHVFSTLKERLNPDSPWRDNLYLNALAYLVGGGLEYADFLRKSKDISENMAKADKAKAETGLQSLGFSNGTKDVDYEYLDWLRKEREKMAKHRDDLKGGLNIEG
jgi:hypothetical protein